MTIRVSHWLDGAIEIRPRGATEAIRKQTLRLYGERVDHAGKADYWDVNAAQVRGALLPMFEAGLTMPATITIRSHGFAGRKVFTVEVAG